MKKIIITIIMSITALVGNQRLCELSIADARAHMIELENTTDPITKKIAKEDLKANVYSAYQDCEGHLTKYEVTKALVSVEAKEIK